MCFLFSPDCGTFSMFLGYTCWLLLLAPETAFAALNFKYLIYWNSDIVFTVLFQYIKLLIL